MLAGGARVRGWNSALYRTDIDEKNVVEHRQPSCGPRKRDSRQLTEKAMESVVPTEAYLDNVAERVDLWKEEDDGKDPIQSR